MKPTFLIPLLLFAIVTLHTYGQSTSRSPKAKKEWVAYAQQVAVPISSRDSDDFSDLQFLIEQIGDKRIVWLGENVHDINDNNVLKFRLIRFLHQEMGYNVVAFEGGVSNCGLANMAKDSLSSMRLLVHSVMGYWRVKSNCQMFDYIEGSGMEIAGFDPNNNALYLPRERYHQLLPGNAALADQYFTADSMHTHYALERGQHYHAGKMNQATAAAMDARRAPLQALYKQISQQLQKVYEQQQLSEHEYQIHQQAIASRLQVLKKANTNIKAEHEFFVTHNERDSLMAKNLEYMADSIYPDQKIIVWAHNGHIAKKGYLRANNHVAMGDYLSKKHKAQSFVMGIFTTRHYLKSKEDRNSLEAVMAHVSHQTSYIPIPAGATITDSNQWLYSLIRHSYFSKKQLPPAALFDGILFLQDVEKSKLIPFNKEFECK